ncbi:phenoloxidase-activating factor 2-like [Contarinia nasturtii]|uniref:phenoloxidase-activating factor 2-like n=1 Tax=Contarinia nasturtii TaxID=265458 RepID=UPI0012D48395|nr:phenoloxidase-activating factor 2-like [Contarinia nasturtii]XP_031632937.1 phenoloxidase-activating factor 2-like [Contarinia nasturtii]
MRKTVIFLALIAAVVVVAHPQAPPPTDTDPKGEQLPELQSKQTLDELISQIFTQDNSGFNQNSTPQPPVIVQGQGNDGTMNGGNYGGGSQQPQYPSQLPITTLPSTYQQPSQPPTYTPQPQQHNIPTQPPYQPPYQPSQPLTPSNEPKNPCQFGSECVPYYQCANGTIITDGEGLLDIRFGQEENIDPQRHPCPGLFNTCCSLRSEVPTIPKVTPNVGCGFRNVDGVGFRITGDKDNEAQFGEFPWTVAILKEEKALDGQILNVYVCGGSLIDHNVVLTAAHCVDKKEPHILKVRAGEWDTQTKDEIFPHQDRSVRDYVIHPEYHRGALHNDVALLFLAQPVDIAENVNTVCLPNPGDVFDHARCFASGWGKDLFGKDGKYQVILKRVELPVVPFAPCLQKLRETRLGNHFNLHKSFICAGGERGRDTCKGDGGSPLVCPILNAPGRYAQAGIVSWGIGCGDATPGVYVNVPMFRQWIDEQMRLNKLTPNSYSQ